jgi:hypothetical protein
MDNFTASQLPYGSAPDDNIDPVFLEHAELIMGPDTILSPSGTPGGTINAFTKSPLFTRGTDISAEVGNYNANRFMVDSTGPLGNGKHWAYRVLAAFQKARTYLPGTVEDWAGGAELTYKFSATANLTFKYFGQQTRTGGSAANPDSNGEQVYTPDTVGGMTLSRTPQPGFLYDGYNGDATWNHRINRDNTVEAELTTALSQYINMRLATCVMWTAENTELAAPLGAETETFDQQTGQQISVTPNSPMTNQPEKAEIEQTISRQIHIQNDYAGNFKVGWVSLQPTVGWAYQQGQIPEDYYVSSSDMPNWTNFQAVYAPPIPKNSTFTNNEGNNPERAWLLQTYAYLRAGFLNDRVFVSGGAARTWANVNDYTLQNVTTKTGINTGPPGPVEDDTFSHTNQPGQEVVQPWAETYMVGILGKVLPNVSVYYNYSTNAQVAGAEPLWQDGKQQEFGFKSSFFNNRLSISADHFQITENNVSSTNPLFATLQSPIEILYADLKSHGNEVNIAGGITKNLSVIASYTDQQLRDFVGRRRRNIPDNMANLLLDYHFTEGVLNKSDAWIGVLHQGSVAGENESGFTSLGAPEQPGYYIPAFTVVNAGVGYQLHNWKFNLNVINLLNQRFWWQAQARHSLEPYQAITITLTMSVHLD